MGKSIKKNRFIIYMSLEIAIPTFNRHLTIGFKTLKLLSCFDNKQIKLYVENEDEYLNYYKYFPQYQIIITNTKGIVEKRNYIMNNSPANYLMMIDDDISNIKDINGISMFPSTIRTLIYTGFDLCDKENVRLWGINPYGNSYYFRDNISTNLKFIIGAFMGIVNNNTFTIPNELKLCEDYYLCIKYFEEDKKILRFNQYGITQNYFKGKGGLQSLYNELERQEEQRYSCDYIKNRFSNYCSIVTKGNGVNLRLNHNAK